MFSLVSVSDIYSTGLATSWQQDGKDQFAASNVWNARNASRQGQNNGQRATSPTDLTIRVGADRPRADGHVDIVDIQNIGAQAAADSFEAQGLNQQALASQPNATLGAAPSRLRGDTDNSGEQRQDSDQRADGSNHIVAFINQPGIGLTNAHLYGAEMYVNNVHGEGTTKGTQLQSIGQKAAVKKTAGEIGDQSFTAAAESGGNAANNAEQAQQSDQRARGRNYLGLSINPAGAYCSPVQLAPYVGKVTHDSTADSLQGQSIDQAALASGDKEVNEEDFEKKLNKIAYQGTGLMSGSGVTITPEKAQTKLQGAIDEQLSTGPEQGNQQTQVGDQHSEASNRARAKNRGAQNQLSDQEIGSSNRWLI